MNDHNNRPDNVQSRQELEDEMSRFEEEISGHTIDRPIIGTNTFQQASQTIHDVHDPHASNFGHFPNQEPPRMQGYPPGGFPPGAAPPRGHPQGGIPPGGHSGGFPQGGIHPKVRPHGGVAPDSRGVPPRHIPPMGVPQSGVLPVHNMNPEMGGQNMPMDNMTYHQPPAQQYPVQQVPFPLPPMPPQMPAQFHPRMQQSVRPGMVPMVPMQVQSTAKMAEHVGITPEQQKEWESAYVQQDAGGGKAKKKDKKFVRVAGGVVWEDTSLGEWDPNDFRIFVGDLGNEVTDESLTRAFAKYPSFQKAKVVREKKTNKTKGYGFVSFKESSDFIKAMREMNGKYVGNRPIKLRKSTWKDRSIDVVKKKVKEKKKLGLR